MKYTVVALLALCAVASHVAVSTAGVAGLLASAKATTGGSSVATASVAATLRAVTSDMADGATLVAFLASRTAGEAAARGLIAVTTGATAWAFARDVSGLATAVARFLLGCYGAFTAWREVQLIIERFQDLWRCSLLLTDMSLA